MKKHCVPAAAIPLLVWAFPVFANFTMDPIIITATRTAQTADESLAAVTVITREDIQRQQALSVADLLRGVAGIGIANSGGLGKDTALHLRGTEADHTLVLVDGVKVGSATLGATAFEHISIEQIERIEIVRGPRSSLYGSEAIGGVVQIFTGKGRGAFTPFFSIGHGSDGTGNASAGFSNGGEHGWFNASGFGLNSAGFNACYGKPSPGGAGCFTIEPDKDGYRNRSGSLGAGYRFDGGLEIDARLLHTNGSAKYDGDFVNQSKARQQVIGGLIRYAPAGAWQFTLAAGRSDDASDNAKDGAFRSRFNTKRETVSMQNDISLIENGLLTVGADYQNDKVDSTVDYALTARGDHGVFVQYQGKAYAHDFQVSLREDDNDQFGNRNTGGFAWGYAIHENVRLNAGFGTAYKAATFNELYYPGFGNAGLRPETSHSYEVGLSDSDGPVRWWLNAFNTRIVDLIAFDAATAGPANIDQARIGGLEAIITANTRHWTWNSNLTLLDPKNRTSDANNGNILPHRSARSFRCDADRKLRHFAFGMTLRAEGKRYDDLANLQKLGAYNTADIRVGYAFAKDWRLQARVENVFDQPYETAAFFHQPGRGFFMAVRYQP